MAGAPALRRFAVLNDFEAIGYGVPVVPPEDLVVLHDAPVQPKVPSCWPDQATPLQRCRLSNSRRSASHMSKLQGSAHANANAQATIVVAPFQTSSLRLLNDRC